MFKYLLGFLGLVGLAALVYVTTRPTPDPIIITRADTIYLPSIPPTIQKEIDLLRTENLSLKDRLKGTTVLKGNGPVVVFDTLVKTDTAVLTFTIKKGIATVRLQAPTDSLSRTIQLPPVKVDNCKDISLGPTGLIRCTPNRFGNLSITTEVVSPHKLFRPETRFGFEWSKGPVTVPVYLSYGTTERVYVGVKFSKTLF